MPEEDLRSRRYVPTYSLPTSTSEARLASAQSSSVEMNVSKPGLVHDRQRRRTTMLVNGTIGNATSLFDSTRKISVEREDVGPAHHKESTVKTPRPPLSSMHGLRRGPMSRLPTPIKDRVVTKTAVASPEESRANNENSTSRQHRLLGPIEPLPFIYSPTTHCKTLDYTPLLHPTLHPQGVPKSSSYNVLSSFKSSLSKNNLAGLTSSRLSVQTLVDFKNDIEPVPTRPIPTLRPGLAKFDRGASGYGPPSPTFPGSHRLIDKALPSSQWIGRLASLRDRFLNELLDEETFHPKLPNIPLFLPLTLPEEQASEDLLDDRRFDPSYRPRSPESVNESSGVYNEVFIYKKIFVHLDAICITAEARRSLRDFQQNFARREKKEELLPIGGTLSDRESMFARAGKFLTGSTNRDRETHGRSIHGHGTKLRVSYANNLGIVENRPTYNRRSLSGTYHGYGSGPCV